MWTTYPTIVIYQGIVEVGWLMETARRRSKAPGTGKGWRILPLV